jgi:predicted acetyltransferase
MTVLEAVAPAPEAARELWRWLLDFDWTSQVVADLLPLDHELFLLLAEPRRMRFELNDGLWVRLVDVGAALAARTYRGDGSVVLGVRDELCSWNDGTWRVSASGVARVDEEPELSLDVRELGSVYLGGLTWAQLARALRVEERVPGAVERADELFRTGAQPWCAEIF